MAHRRTVDLDFRLQVHESDGNVEIALEGEWTQHSGPIAFEEAVGGSLAGAKSIAFEAARLRKWDTTLIAFLFEGYRVAEKAEIEYRTDTLPKEIASLLALATAVPQRDTGDDAGEDSLVERVGEQYLSIQRGFWAQMAFVGETVLAVGRLMVGRSQMRLRDFWVVVEEHGPRALPIVTLICLLVGMIVAFLGSVVLTKFGAGIYNAHLVGYGMFRELGALMTGIIMVGRSGAAFAAEIGSMKVSEEIDAYETLGISPFDFVVMPRMLALFLMMPLLTVVGDLVGVFGGMIVSAALMDLAPRLFLGNLFDAVGVSDMVIGLLKGVVFGALIAISGCLRGLQSGSSADAVGKAATSAVVTGITLIIGANAIIDWLASIL